MPQEQLNNYSSKLKTEQSTKNESQIRSDFPASAVQSKKQNDEKAAAKGKTKNDSTMGQNNQKIQM